MPFGKLTVESHISKENYRTALYFNLVGQKKSLFPFLIAAAALSALRVLGAAIGFYPGMDLLFWGSAGYLVIVAAVVGLAQRQVNAYAAAGRADARQRLELSEEGLTDKSPGVKEPVFFPWESMLGGYELKSLLLIYVTQQRAILIPRADLPDNGKTVTALFREKLGPHFIPRSR